MSTVVDITMSLRTVSALNAREHWAAKARRVKAERAATDVALSAGPGWRIQQRLRRRLTRGGQLVVLLERESRGALDDDNLRAAFKGVRDQVAEWLGVDDRDPRVRWAYAQSRAPGFAVRIAIETEVADG